MKIGPIKYSICVLVFSLISGQLWAGNDNFPNGAVICSILLGAINNPGDEAAFQLEAQKTALMKKIIEFNLDQIFAAVNSDYAKTRVPLRDQFVTILNKAVERIKDTDKPIFFMAQNLSNAIVEFEINKLTGGPTIVMDVRDLGDFFNHPAFFQAELIRALFAIAYYEEHGLDNVWLATYQYRADFVSLLQQNQIVDSDDRLTDYLITALELKGDDTSREQWFAAVQRELADIKRERQERLARFTQPTYVMTEAGERRYKAFIQMISNKPVK